MNFAEIRDKYGHKELSDTYAIFKSPFWVYPAQKNVFRLVELDGELVKFVDGVEALTDDPYTESDVRFYTLGQMKDGDST